jgi:hypothetical protein
MGLLISASPGAIGLLIDIFCLVMARSPQGCYRPELRKSSGT